MEARGKGKKPDWAQVAAQMAEKGWNVTSSGCKSRWNNHLKHVHGGLRVEVEWTQAEVSVCVLEMLKVLKNSPFLCFAIVIQQIYGYKIMCTIL